MNFDNSVIYHYDKFPPSKPNYAAFRVPLLKATDTLELPCKLSSINHASLENGHLIAKRLRFDAKQTDPKQKSNKISPIAF